VDGIAVIAVGQPYTSACARYMNQYMLSVDGPREVAVDINALIAEHIRSKLLLDVTAEEEDPVPIKQDSVEFLDFRLCRYPVPACSEVFHGPPPVEP
jgi:hypothetical protein